MKLIKYTKKIVNVKANSKRHAVDGEIITDKKIFRPYFVICSYFDPWVLEKYGEESDEVLYHGTNYVDCVDVYGRIHRLQYYEYAILINSKRIASNFRKKFPQLDEGFSYHIGNILEATDESIEIYN